MKAAMGLLKSHLPPSFSLNLLNLGATNFKEARGDQGAAGKGGALERFLGKRKAPPPPDPAPALPPGIPTLRGCAVRNWITNPGLATEWWEWIWAPLLGLHLQIEARLFEG